MTVSGIVYGTAWLMKQLPTGPISMSRILNGQATAIHDEQQTLAYRRRGLKTISP